MVTLIILLISLGSVSHVDFKKSPCCSVEFRGQGHIYGYQGVDCCLRRSRYTHSDRVSVGDNISITFRECK